MNKKYVLTGNNWIVTSGEIVVTPLDGTRPMHPAQSKKLYDQNMQHYTQHKKPGVWWQIQYNVIIETVTTVDKYTIVELTHNNKHYHGTASRANCDKENAVTGIAVAYHRAFDKMMGGIKIGVAKYNKNNSNTRGSCPSIFVFDDYFSPPDVATYDENKSKMMHRPQTNRTAVDATIDFFKKHQESKAHFRKCLLGTFGVTKKEVGLKEDDDTHAHKARTQKEIWAINKFKTGAYCRGLRRFTQSTSIDDIIHKKSKLAEKAISDLLACTGVELRQYDLKTIHGAKDALEEISKYGYNIYELQNTDPLNLTYILQRCGIEITRRDINLTLPTDLSDETQNNLRKHLRSIVKERSEFP